MQVDRYELRSVRLRRFTSSTLSSAADSRIVLQPPSQARYWSVYMVHIIERRYRSLGPEEEQAELLRGVRSSLSFLLDPRGPS